MERYNIQIPKTSKHVKMDQKYLGFEIKPLSYEKLKIRVVTNVDPHLKFIPMSVINWINRKVYYLKTI